MGRITNLAAVAGFVALVGPLAPSVVAQGNAAASTGRAYTEGPVVELTYVRTKPGMFDRYMAYLQSTYKRVVEAQKSDGLITDYGIYATDARTPQDHDVILVVEYKNWAALDNFTERADAVSARITGMNPAQASQATVDRGAMREILGTRMYQQLKLK